MPPSRTRAGSICVAFLLLGLCTLALLESSAALANTWELASSSTSLGHLSSVSCAAPSACMSVGGHEGQRWNGNEWSLMSLPEHGAEGYDEFYSISCWEANGCMTVGEYTGTAELSPSDPLAELWNGSEWSVKLPAAKKNGWLAGVSCVSASECNAVGTYPATTGALAFAEHWDGTAWKTVALPKLTTTTKEESELNGVACSSSTACTAVGSYLLYEGPNIGEKVVGEGVLTEAWNGSKWSVQSTQGAGGALRAISCTAATACTAVGGTLAERWNGRTWTTQSTSALSGDSLNSVSCASSTYCIAVGSREKEHVAVAALWDGTEWSGETVPQPEGVNERALFTGVSCPSTTSCAAVGWWEPEEKLSKRRMLVESFGL